MSTLYRNRRFAESTQRERLIDIERRFATPNYDQVRHLQNAYGLRWADACHAERLDRQISKLEAQGAAVGFSDADRQKIYELERKMKNFIRAARRLRIQQTDSQQAA